MDGDGIRSGARSDDYVPEIQWVVLAKGDDGPTSLIGISGLWRVEMHQMQSSVFYETLRLNLVREWEPRFKGLWFVRLYISTENPLDAATMARLEDIRIPPRPEGIGLNILEASRYAELELKRFTSLPQRRLSR